MIRAQSHATVCLQIQQFPFCPPDSRNSLPTRLKSESFELGCFGRQRVGRQKCAVRRWKRRKTANAASLSIGGSVVDLQTSNSETHTRGCRAASYARGRSARTLRIGSASRAGCKKVLPEERAAICDFALAYPKIGYRKLTWMVVDAGTACVGGSTFIGC